MAEPSTTNNCSNNRFISISFAHVMAESSISTGAPGDDIAIATTHQTITAVPTNKRKANDDNNSLNPLLDVPRSNKRRKKNKKKKKGGKQHTQHNSKKNNKQQHKKQQNWIESCSDSIDRIPANCAAPLTCVITRVEIEEEPLLPKGSKSTDESGPGGDDIESIITSPSIHDGNLSADVPADSKTAANETSTTDGDQSNIARPSQTFVSQYEKERDPWMIPSTVKENNEEKNLFIPVKRDGSAKGPTKWAQRRKKNGGGKQQQTSSFCHLPNGDNGDGILNPYPTSAVPDKFWAQRKRLFSRYDEGIQIGGAEDPEMWYSVTPESIANHVAERMVKMMRRVENPSDPGSRPKQEVVVLDVFCGCGGNSIAFARLSNVKKKWQGDQPHVKVIAVDNNLSRLKMAASNAAIYKINRDDIVFIHADAVEVLNHYSNGSRKSWNKDIESRNYESYAGFDFGGLDLLPDKKLDGVFLSPPWGGMSYTDQGKDGFDPVTSIMVESSSSANQKGGDEAATSTVKTNGGELLSLASKAVSFNQAFGVVVYFLPRNTDGIALAQSAVNSGIGGCFEFEQNVVNGKVKTTTAYFQSGLQVGSFYPKMQLR